MANRTPLVELSAFPYQHDNYLWTDTCSGTTLIHTASEEERLPGRMDSCASKSPVHSGIPLTHEPKVPVPQSQAKAMRRAALKRKPNEITGKFYHQACKGKYQSISVKYPSMRKEISVIGAANHGNHHIFDNLNMSRVPDRANLCGGAV